MLLQMKCCLGYFTGLIRNNQRNSWSSSKTRIYLRIIWLTATQTYC